MSKVVNLGKFRKAKAKDEKAQKSAENRRKHGRTKGQKITDKAREETNATSHDGNKLDGPDDKDPA